MAADDDRHDATLRGPDDLALWKVARGARAQGAVLAPTAIFAFVYLAMWAAFSIAAAIAQLLLIRMGFVSEMTLAFGNWRIGGALLIAAGLYQLTPLKRACLEVLPLADVLPDAPLASSPGQAQRASVSRMDSHCLGCCALLMALLFVFGVMNLAWVAALSLFVLIEKVLPFGSRIGTLGGFIAVCVGAVMMI